IDPRVLSRGPRPLGGTRRGTMTFGGQPRTVAISDKPPLKPAEAVQTHSGALRKELGLFDLVLAQLLIIIVADYIGTAVKAGTSHVAFWLIAIGTFFVPQALVVMHLSRQLPIEGGLYEWARIAFNDRIGF